jgi:hypothetical protein
LLPIHLITSGDKSEACFWTLKIGLVWISI